MRENLGIKDAENVGEMRKVCSTAEAASASREKLSYTEGINYACSVELPKLDVTGSIPVARSKTSLGEPVVPFARSYTTRRQKGRTLGR